MGRDSILLRFTERSSAVAPSAGPSTVTAGRRISHVFEEQIEKSDSVGSRLVGRSLVVTGFERELVSHREKLFRYVMKLVHGRRDDAEDLVQDVFIKAMKAQHTFETETHMGAWLKKIALNTHINSQRRSRIHREALEVESDFDWTGEATRRPSMDPESAAVGAVRKEIREQIRSLPQEYAEMIAMVDLEGLRYVEAAAEVGCPLGTVMSRLHRGRKLLAERMAA